MPADVMGLATAHWKNMRDSGRPAVPCISATKKGRGYEPKAEKARSDHFMRRLNLIPSPSGCLPEKQRRSASYSKFGDWLCGTARQRQLMAITPAMRQRSRMVEFSRKFLDRYFDVAIAEQHAVTFCRRSV